MIRKGESSAEPKLNWIMTYIEESKIVYLFKKVEARETGGLMSNASPPTLFLLLFFM